MCKKYTWIVNKKPKQSNLFEGQQMHQENTNIFTSISNNTVIYKAIYKKVLK